MSSLKSEGIRAFIWSFSGKLGSQGIAFIASIFLARLLEPAEFGLVAMVSVIIVMAQVFSDVGLGAALIQRKRVLPVHYSSVFYFNISIGFLLSLLTFLSAPLIADFYNQDQLVQLTQVMSLLFLLNAFSTVQSIRLRKDLRFSLLTKIRVASGLIGGVIGVVAALYEAGVWSLVAMSLSIGISYNILIWIVSGWFPSLLFSFQALLELLGFGSRYFLAALLNTIIPRLDIIVIGKLFDVATLGLFQRAKTLNSMVMQYSSGALIPVLFPVLSKVQDNLPYFQNISIKIFGIVNFIVFLLLGGLYLVSENLIVLLFTEKWLPSADYLKILLLSGFEIPVSAMFITILNSRGNSKAVLRFEIYRKSIYIINLFNILLIGLEGYLYALIPVAAFSCLIGMVFASREIHVPIRLFIKPLITQITISVSAVIFIVSLRLEIDSYIIAIIFEGALFTCIYFFMNWLFRTTSYHYCYEQVAPMIKRKISSYIGSQRR